MATQVLTRLLGNITPVLACDKSLGTPPCDLYYGSSGHKQEFIYVMFATNSRWEWFSTLPRAFSAREWYICRLTGI